jgi:hypothetical protein
MSIGHGLTGVVPWTVADLDSSPTTDKFSVWDAGNERFQIITVATYPDYVLGSVGDFADGYIKNWWTGSWSTEFYGFAVTEPTSAEMLDTDTVPADIIAGDSMPNMTYVDTDEEDDSVIERSNLRSTSYTRIFQILVKSEDDTDPTGNVVIGFNTDAGTRTVDADTWYRPLPGTRGWWAVMLDCPSDPVATTIYITMSFKAGTGRWYISSPFFYNKFTTFENIVRAPIPYTTTAYQRGQWSVNSSSDVLRIGPAGWLGMSIVMPDRSKSNGHLDYAGAENYTAAGLLSWISGTYRLRVMMSDTYDRLIVQMDNDSTSFAYLDLGDDWQDWERIGLCVCWGISNGAQYANLYVNGKKLDSVSSPADWYPQTLGTASLYIGIDQTNSSAAADCWIPRVALGKQSLHRSLARKVSLIMRDLARAGNIGDM